MSETVASSQTARTPAESLSIADAAATLAERRDGGGLVGGAHEPPDRLTYVEQVLLWPRLTCHPHNEEASILATFSYSGRGNCRLPRAAASTASRPLREYPPRC